MIFLKEGKAMERCIPYTFYVSGKAKNDRAIIKMVEEKEKEESPLRFFCLPYTPPFQNFDGIKKFQKIAAYRPFADGIRKGKVIAINLEEWLGHEEEAYLEIFFRFLHDYTPFLKFEYIFTAGNLEKEEAEPLYSLMKKYLGRGEMEHEERV